MLPPAWSVTIRGAQYYVDAEWIASAMSGGSRRSWAERRTMTLDRLKVVRDEALALDTVPSDARLSARGTPRESLTRREIRDRNATDDATAFWAPIRDWLHSLRLRLGLGSVSAGTIAIAIAWVAACGALLGFGAWLYLRARSRRATTKPRRSEPEAGLP